MCQMDQKPMSVEFGRGDRIGKVFMDAVVTESRRSICLWC